MKAGEQRRLLPLLRGDLSDHIGSRKSMRKQLVKELFQFGAGHAFFADLLPRAWICHRVVRFGVVQ